MSAASTFDQPDPWRELALSLGDSQSHLTSDWFGALTLASRRPLVNGEVALPKSKAWTGQRACLFGHVDD
jgi:hypothetical protein